MIKKRLMLCILSVSFMLTVSGCASELKDAYVKNDGSFYFLEDTVNHHDRFAANLAVIPKLSYLDEGFKDEVSSAVLINETTNTPIIASNAHARIYPASLTKLMTAYLTSKYAKMDDMVTVPNDLVYEAGAQILHLKKGDKLSVSELYHGLLVYSANDCATVLGQHIAGSEKKFVELMNKEAKALGATNTHFMNPHGLHNDKHYTTAYDLYLMFHANLEYSEFLKTIALPKYTLKYTNRNKIPVSITVETTNQYLSGTYQLPADVTMIGGKTGTTQAAGSCLIVLTQNQKKEDFISVVTGATDKTKLYASMTKLLQKENK